jgi:cysteinyl-tRNA synthetase
MEEFVKMNLHITNTFSGKKEKITFEQGKNIHMYVCGITPYDFAHIGHARCYVTFDVVYRLLSFLGYEKFKVLYCRNFTDIDDKLIARAHKELGDAKKYAQIAQKYIDAYVHDMKDLNCQTPDYQPRVTEYVPQIIDFIQQLIAKDSAYEKNGSVYFRVRSYTNYGQLSKRDIDDLISGARVQVDEDKEDPLDFALWKKDDEVGFNSPWGMGRPGWHIECSVMAQECLGHVDIHGGGMDLLFPHHENERAQSEALTGSQFVQYWMHNAFINVNKEKMSKSLGNFFTLRDVLKEVHPMVLRYYLVRHWYRNPLEFSLQDIAADQKAYKKIVDGLRVTMQNISQEQVQQNQIVQKMLACLTDDFNTSGMFGVLFEHLSEIKHDEKTKACVAWFLEHVLGIQLVDLPEKEIEITPEIQTLLDEREQARAQKDWTRSDALREQLKALGYEAQDKKIN